MDKLKLAVVIPAYNEAERLAPVLAGLKGKADWLIVVDDASGDQTAAVAEQSGALVLKHLVNRGQGAALRTGTHQALALGAEIIVHFDADGQFLVSDIPALIKPIADKQADIVFGSRFLLKEKNQFPFFKRWFLFPLARLVNRWLLGINQSDPQIGLRAFNRAAAEGLNWREDRMAHCSEILALAKNWRVAEVPATVIYTRYGQGLSGGLRIIKELFLNKLSR